MDRRGSAGRPDRSGGRTRDRRPDREPDNTRGWGNVARRGARNLAEPAPGSAAGEWRAAVERARTRDRAHDAETDRDIDRRPPRWQPDEVWLDEGDVEPRPTRPSRPPGQPRARQPATRSPRPAPARETRAAKTAERAAPRRPRATVPPKVLNALVEAAGPRRGPHLAELLGEAHDHYQHERYRDARRILKGLTEEAPRVAEIHELFGLTLYRMGSWRPAVRELEVYREATGAFDEHPVLADAYRALGRHKKVQELWDELRQASPRADLVGEGRMVAAGSLADQGDISGAIKILERGRHNVRHPRDHHLRQWYALANLYERAGEIPAARELYRRVASHDPDAYDVRDRLKSLD